MVEPVTLQTLLTYLTLISVPIGVFYHIMTLNNTRKAREAQIFVQFSNRMGESRWSKGLREIGGFSFKNYEELRKHYELEANIEKWENIIYFYMFMEDLGGLVRGGYLGIQILAYTTMGPILTGWEKIAPYVDDGREYFQNPRLWTELEYLYKEIKKYIKEHPELKT